MTHLGKMSGVEVRRLPEAHDGFVLHSYVGRSYRVPVFSIRADSAEAVVAAACDYVQRVHSASLHGRIFVYAEDGEVGSSSRRDGDAYVGYYAVVSTHEGRA